MTDAGATPPGCLAIVTTHLGRPTEISQARHVAQLFGGRTIVVCNAIEPAHDPARPVFRRRPKPRGMARLRPALARLAQAAIHGESGVPYGCERRALEDFLRDHQAFAILAEFGNLGSAMAPVGAALGIPVFAYFRGYDASQRLTSWRRIRGYRRAVPRLAGHIAVSQSLLDNLAALGIEHPRRFVVPSGVDTRRFAPAEKDAHLLVAVGRLVPKKAPDLTIRAFARLACDFPRHRLEIIGDGVLRPRCADLVDELGLSHRITLHGRKDHAFVRDRLSRASIFLQHSVRDEEGNEEGLPIAIQEAMAAGAAIVSTNHAGIGEAITSGEHGLLVAERDLDGYVRAIRSLLNDEAERARLAQKARDRVRAEFEVDSVHARLERIIAAACRQRTPAPPAAGTEPAV
jgi:colanic acid/amylovoran biosynthesis glycosyltransferase